MIISATLIAGCADRTLSEPQPWRCPTGWVVGSILDGQCLDGAGFGGPTQYAYDCSVSDVTGFGTRNQIESVLPFCNDTTTPASSTNKPCWAIAPDPQACVTGNQLKFWVERSEPLSPETTAIAYCEACVDAQ